MPLITFTGLPCCGKSHYARDLQKRLLEKIADSQFDYKVVLIDDAGLGITPDDYKESHSEKFARGKQLTAVKRELSRSTFVILDSLSYIKGFRYQLHCEAKETVTPHCTIHVLSSLEKCIENNKDQKWDKVTISQLAMRYEEPNPDARWDAPLFEVVSGDDDLPFPDIWDALVLRKAPPPNAATLVKPTSGNDYIQELDKKTLLVVQAIARHQQVVAAGGIVKVDSEVSVSLPANTVSTAQLQRIRRTFIGMNRMRSIEIARIVPVFADYVEKSLED